MVITEMDKGKEKLLAVARTYLYSVDIQIVDSAKHLRDKLGYLGKLFLFECYSLLVLINYNRQIKKFPTEKQNVSLKHILT